MALLYSMSRGCEGGYGLPRRFNSIQHALLLSYCDVRLLCAFAMVPVRRDEGGRPDLGRTSAKGQ